MYGTKTKSHTRGASTSRRGPRNGDTREWVIWWVRVCVCAPSRSRPQRQPFALLSLCHSHNWTRSPLRKWLERYECSRRPPTVKWHTRTASRFSTRAQLQWEARRRAVRMGNDWDDSTREIRELQIQCTRTCTVFFMHCCAFLSCLQSPLPFYMCELCSWLTLRLCEQLLIMRQQL